MPLVCELMKLHDLRSHRLISAQTCVPMLNKCCYANVVFEFFGWRQWHFLHTVQSGVPFINSEAEHVTKEVRHFRPVPQNAILKTAKKSTCPVFRSKVKRKTHTYCHLGLVQTESCCVSSSPLPLGKRSCQWVLWLLPPESEEKSQSNHLTSSFCDSNQDTS